MPVSRSSGTKQRRGGLDKEAAKHTEALKDRLKYGAAYDWCLCCIKGPGVLLDPIPYESNITKIIDLTSGSALVYTALLTPYEVAFLTEEEAETVNGWFWLNRIVDIIFWVDLILQFRIIPEPNSEAEASKKIHFLAPLAKYSQGAVERYQQMEDGFVGKSINRKIAITYLRGRFAVDFFTCMVSFFDYASYMIARDDESSGASTSGISRQLKLLRLLRLLRIMKLFRLLNASRFTHRLRVRMAVNYSTQTIVECLCGYVVLAHWLGCIFYLQTVFYTSRTGTWIFTYGYCVYASDASSDENASWVVSPEPEGDPVVLCAPPPEMWLASTFWMLQLISGTAGGPVDHGLFSVGETVVFFFLVICAALAWGYLLGRFCDVLSNLDPERNLFRQRMDHLNRWIKANRFDSSTAIQLRTYMYLTKHIQISKSNMELMELFSPKLRGDASLAINHFVYEKVAFLSNIETECLLELLQRLQPLVLVPGERASTTCMYVLTSGYVLHRGSMLRPGSFWGVDCILCDARLRRFAGRAIVYVELQFLARDDIIEVAEDYPVACSRVRWAAIRTALIRYLLDQEIERTTANFQLARLKVSSRVAVLSRKMTGKLKGQLRARTTDESVGGGNGESGVVELARFI